MKILGRLLLIIVILLIPYLFGVLVVHFDPNISTDISLIVTWVLGLSVLVIIVTTLTLIFLVIVWIITGNIFSLFDYKHKHK